MSVFVMGVQARQHASTAACARRGAMGLDQVRGDRVVHILVLPVFYDSANACFC